MLYADGVLMRLLERRAVGDRLRVEHHHVRVEARRERSPSLDAEIGGREYPVFVKNGQRFFNSGNDPGKSPHLFVHAVD